MERNKSSCEYSFTYDASNQDAVQNQILLLKEEVKHLKHKNKQLENYNQQILTDLAESKQKENKLKQLNNILTQNLKQSSPNVHQSIKLTLQGEFMNQRIIELQEQLQKYRNGVHESVERRVKKIVGQVTEQKELDYSKKASRLTSKKLQTHNHNIMHNHYKIEYNKSEGNFTNVDSVQSSLVQKYQININQQTKNICPKCVSLAQNIQQYSYKAKQLQKQLEEALNQLRAKQIFYTNLKKENQAFKRQFSFLKNNKNSQNNQAQKQQIENQMNQYIQDISQQYEDKLKQLDNKWQIRYDNLLEQYQLLLDELNAYGSKRSNNQQYFIQQSPINKFKKKEVFQVNCESEDSFYQNNRQQMMKDISNLVKDLGNRKQRDEKCLNNQNFNKSRMTQKNSKTGSSRLNTTRTQTFMFTIKEGVNRPCKNTFY